MSELSSQSMSIQSVYNWYSENKLYVNRRYQRKLVWTLEEKQKLVESILKKYPIPAILLAEREDSPLSYEIIDGLQRLHAIISFIENSFSTPNKEYFDVSHFTTANTRADEGHFSPVSNDIFISPKDVGTVLDYSLAISIMRSAEDDEIDDVFDRINTYGHRLSDQERRQAGVRNDFSEIVRNISCSIRGDVSTDILLLGDMPAISIDLPRMQHGYEVKSDEVFWINQGILRSTDLRDSMDEQCVADIVACIVNGEPIERSKDALDDIYTSSSSQNRHIISCIDIYGKEKVAEEFKYCVDMIVGICESDGNEKLRDIIFSQRSTNAFPSVFTILMLSFHELLINEKMKVGDKTEIRKSLNNIYDRIDTSRRANQASERRKNIDVVKALIRPYFVESGDISHVYSNHAVIDIETIIRRSEIELADYELKQGLLAARPDRSIEHAIFDKILSTICAIANNGRGRTGKLLIGVTDTKDDAEYIAEIDDIQPRRIGKRYVVGIRREAEALGLELEDYVQKLREKISNSSLSGDLKSSVLAHIDFNEYFGLGIIVITIHAQSTVSFLGEDTYFREADSTQKAKSAREIGMLYQRF